MSDKSDKRSARLWLVIDGYAGNEDLEDVVVDILTDLRHLCDAEGLDFAQHDRTAYQHYLEEK